MRVRIYQIDTEIQSEYIKDRITLVNFESIYKQVFCAVIDEESLNDIFKRFSSHYTVLYNTLGHPLYRGKEMSVGDIIVVENKAYIREQEDFREIAFDESKTIKQENLLRIVYVEPHKPAYESWIENSLESEQQAVGGYIELIYPGDNTIIVCNEEAKILGLEGNRHLDNGTSVIAGSFFIVGAGEEEDFRSLTDEEVAKYVKKYSEPEDISQEETLADTGFVIYSL